MGMKLRGRGVGALVVCIRSPWKSFQVSMEKLQIVLDSVGCMYRVSMEKLQMLYSSFQVGCLTRSAHARTFWWGMGKL